MTLKDDVALVTGAASGIGLGLARALARRGATVVLADLNEDAAEAAAEQLRNDGAMRVDTLQMDVANHDDWHRATAEIKASYGGVSIICNNAGIATPRAPVGHYDKGLWDKVMGVNLTSVFLGCTAFLSDMRLPGRPGYILNTASISGLIPTPQMAAYCASKHAVLALSDVIRFEQADTDVTVTALCPGFVATAIAGRPGSATDPERAAMQNRLAASMNPDEVAERAVAGLLAGEAYVFSHAEYGAVIARRAEILGDAIARSAPGLPPDDITVLGKGWLG